MTAKIPPSTSAAHSSSLVPSGTTAVGPDDKWLSSLLKNEALVVSDDGFTDHVLGKLPRTRSRKSRLSRRDITLVSFGVVAGAVGAFGFARGTIALDTPLQILCAVGVVGLGLWAALSSENA
jgi:hypothetical protein